MAADESSDRPVTIYEVARAAEVSPSTVSRTFTRPGRVSVRTADHVRAVAAELGYRDDTPYRAKSAARNHAIALAVTDATNPFNSAILRSAANHANKAGYTMVMMDAQESVAQERSNFDRILPQVDGVIIASSLMSDTVLRSVAKTHPLVILNRYVGGLPSVVPDTSHGMKQAIAHLLQLNHNTVHYLAGPDSSWISGMRWLAIRAAAASMGFTAHRVGPILPSVEGGAAAASQVIARRATAVICYNDLMAMGLTRALTHKGYSIPSDLSIIGCDNIFASDLVMPALTTIAAPIGVLGDTAVKHILAMLVGAKAQLSAPITIPVRLIVRESTGACPVKRLHLSRA
ncbi:MAG: LacI family transcriptional regulator [Propionibacteriaceae bacterium]|jgi:LacI family transcriptional regulator|nr:LacI family transcriptional regulator [Propionibacteriaceae bacterium]